MSASPRKTCEHREQNSTQPLSSKNQVCILFRCSQWVRPQHHVTGNNFTGELSHWRHVPKARILEAGDLILPEEVGLQMVGTAVLQVQRLHWLVDALAVDR